MAYLVVTQRFWRSPTSWILLFMTTVTAAFLIAQRETLRTTAAVLAVLAAGWAAGIWAVRNTWLRLTTDSIEIRNSGYGRQKFPRGAVKTIDAHPRDDVLFFGQVDQHGRLPGGGWVQADLERLARELQAHICTGDGPACPARRRAVPVRLRLPRNRRRPRA
jgi:hypothetical protein